MTPAASAGSPPGHGDAGSDRRRSPFHGPGVAALAAFIAALPGLFLPFLSDDWAQLERASSGWALRTPYADFRPLFMASFRGDWLLFGAAPAFFHLTNALLLAAAAAAVAAVAARLARDGRCGALAGVLFALHPWHVEPAAWIAARGEALSTVPFLLALLAYDRWRREARGLPWAALLAFAAALLAKETAVTLPALVLLIGLLDPARRPGRRELARGLLPLALLAALHFLVLRPFVLGGPGRTLLGGFGMSWVRNGLGYAAAALVPVPPAALAARPAAWGGAAIVVLAVLAAAARRGSGRLPPAALGAAAAFGLLIVPSLVGFQARYLFLASAAGCLALASLLTAARGIAGRALGGALLLGWLACAGAHWTGWRQAALASERLLEGLAGAAGRRDARQVVVANMPLRVGGGSVGGDFRAALALRGARPVEVRAAAWLSFPTAHDDGLDGPPGIALRKPPPHAEVYLVTGREARAEMAGPPARRGLQENWTGSILADGAGRYRVRIVPDAAAGRVAYAWAGGRLVPLF